MDGSRIIWINVGVLRILAEDQIDQFNFNMPETTAAVIRQMVMSPNYKGKDYVEIKSQALGIPSAYLIYVVPDPRNRTHYNRK